MGDGSISRQRYICPFHLLISPLDWSTQQPLKPLHNHQNCSTLVHPSAYLVWNCAVLTSVIKEFRCGFTQTWKGKKKKKKCTPFPHRRRFLSCRLSWMILLTNSSSPPSAMISVTPPVFTELGGGRREFLEFTPWREQQDRRGSGWNPIRGLLVSRKQWFALFTLRGQILHGQTTSQNIQTGLQQRKTFKMLKKGKHLPLLPAGWQKKEGCTCRSRTLFPSLLLRRPSAKSSEAL